MAACLWAGSGSLLSGNRRFKNEPQDHQVLGLVVSRVDQCAIEEESCRGLVSETKKAMTVPTTINATTSP